MPNPVTNKINRIQKIALFVAPLLSIIIVLFADLDPENRKVTYCFAIALLMAIWWITEAVSISVTALLPLILFPLLKVMPINDVGANYGSKIIFLFFGGFVLALALEKVNLHKRIALNIIKITGTTPNKV